MGTLNSPAAGPQSYAWAECHQFALSFRVLASPLPLLSARSLPISPHKRKMLQGQSSKAHLTLLVNSVLAAVIHLAGDASQELVVGIQLPLFVGVREHPQLLEASLSCSPGSLLLTPQPTAYTCFSQSELQDLHSVGLFSSRIPTRVLTETPQVLIRS